MKPAILLTQLRGIEHLATALLDRACLDLVSLYDVSIGYLNRHGIPSRPLNSFLSAEDRREIELDAARRAAAIASALYGPTMRREWPEYDDATWSALTAEIVALLRRDFYEEMVLIEALRRCASEADLRLIIVPQDICRDTKTLVYAGHRLGVPSMHILHGFPYGTTNIHDGSFADVLAAYSEPAKAIYESFGVSPERIIVTGNPEWDVYSRPMSPGFRGQACAALGVDPARPIIVYALSYSHGFSKVSALHPLYTHKTTQAVARAFAELARKHPDWQFVLRPHPNDPKAPTNLDFIAREAELHPVWIDNKSSASACLAIADVVACTQSNLGVEAILLGKPVVNCVIDEFAEPVFLEGMGPLFSEDDAVVFVRTVEDIAPAVEAALLDPKTRERLGEARAKTIRKFNYLNDGKATERVLDIILDMVSQPAEFAPAVERWPEFEPSLAEAVPEASMDILVIGRAARDVCEAIQAVRENAVVRAVPSLDPSHREEHEVVVWADPAPLPEEAKGRFLATQSLLAPDGVMVAWFLSGEGADQGLPATCYTHARLDKTLSQCGFEAGQIRAVPADALERETLQEGALTLNPTRSSRPVLGARGWVVRARALGKGPSPFAEAREARRQRAREANARGEALFDAGDFAAAAAAFTEAITTWHEEALYYNNLGAALVAVNALEGAWDKFLEALHHNPRLDSAWANLQEIAPLLGRTQEAEQLLRLFGPG